LFFSSLKRSGKKQADTGGRDRTEAEGGWQGVSESAVSAKRGWVWFGAKAAQSETPVRAAAKRRPPGRARSGGRRQSLPFRSVGRVARGGLAEKSVDFEATLSAVWVIGSGAT